MALPPQFDEPAFGGVRRLDRAIDRGQSRIFRVLWFWLPPGHVARDIRFEGLVASRFLTDVAMQALLYGSLIEVARRDGGAIDAALLGAAYLLPGALLGLFGGIVADALPKRIALGGAYLAMGTITLLEPRLFGTSIAGLAALLLGVRLLYQVSHPSEASALPLVASNAELASVTSLLNLASAAGEVVGKALLAPVIVRFYGVEPVTVLAGLLLLVSSTRVIDLHLPHRHPELEEAAGHLEPPLRIPTVTALRWLLHEPWVLWMLLFGALGSTASQVLGVLGPAFTGEVLDVDPANALYVFAPAALGLLGALAVVPTLIQRVEERAVARLGFALTAFALTGIGLAPQLADLPWVPVLDLPGVTRPVEVASALSFILGLAITFAAVSSQTFIARRVPLAIQGRTFALLSSMKDALAILSLLGLGFAAEVAGVQRVITLSPWVLLGIALGVERLARRFRGRDPGDAAVGVRV